MYVFGMILDAALVLTAAAMCIWGKYGITRELAFLPALTGVLDGVLVGEIVFSLTPVLSVLLVVLQGVILTFSGLMLYQDRVRFRNKQLRRRREDELTHSRLAFEQAAARSRASGKRRARRVCA